MINSISILYILIITTYTHNIKPHWSLGHQECKYIALCISTIDYVQSWYNQYASYQLVQVLQ